MKLLTERGLEVAYKRTANGFVTRPATFLEKLLYAIKHKAWPKPLTFKVD